MSSHIYHACLPKQCDELKGALGVNPLPLGKGGLVPSQIQPLSLWERVAEGRCDPSQIQPLSLWERVAEGRVRAPPTTLPASFRAVPGGAVDSGTLTPTLSQRERGSEGGLLALGTLTPTLSQRERGSEGCETNLRDKSSEQEPQQTVLRR